jgi:hypothetical protein
VIPIENVRWVAAMVGRGRKLRLYPREFTALKGINIEIEIKKWNYPFLLLCRLASRQGKETV